ncbi:linear amide C-N hydrolase [Methanococcus maripaludis]|uniref:Choloylglycine hydrolase n=1 Tax=Methanococcus maripaludis TaxID=39152 RepID=A0A7J9SCG1_METMI|nr:linear amide C-N hydrolase [Methanococcus maripaludis]MBB6497778.1 choloylglycine hydrolase [Methanococcus maripaludis]
MCTRILLDYDGKIVTSRTMDWHNKLDTSIWAFPKGIKRDSMDTKSKHVFHWTSKYDSLVVCESFPNNKTPYSASADGINEEGLVVNSLWLSESSYNLAVGEISEKHISVGIWVQYMLDNYKDVKDAVTDWITGNYRVVTMKMPGEAGKLVNMHLSISDAEGNSAIFEFYSDNDFENARLHITTNLDIIVIEKDLENVKILQCDCPVMTNSPVFEQQIKLNYFWSWQWENFKNSVMQAANKASQLKTLPGTSRAPDRFTRASFYLNGVNKPQKYFERIAQVFSIMKTVTVPIEYIRTDKAPPTISNTLWTSVYDHNRKRLFFQTSYLPSTYWCDLNKLKLDDKNYLRCYLIDDAKHKGDIINGGDISNKMEIRRSEDFKFILSSD